jgi:hypoxanthine phosphoribosyltransferase
MTAILDEVAYVEANSECLLNEQETEDMLTRLAAEITEQCEYQNPLVLCVMTGAVIAVGKLLTRLNFPLELDYIHATRYQGKTSGGELSWKQYPSVSLKDRTVIIIDDVLDEGITMQYLLDYCLKQEAKKCYIAVLVNKNIASKKPVAADFVGVELGNQYLYGLGMDYKGYLRNVEGIYACPENIQEHLCQH